MIIGSQAKRELLTALLIGVKILIHKNFSILHDLNAMGNEIKTVLLVHSAVMASNSCKVFNLDVSLSISLGARPRY